MFISIYIMKVFVVILALAGTGYAAYKMKKNPESKTSMIVFMALGLAIAWLTTAAEIRRSETERIVITPNPAARIKGQDLDKAVEEAKKKADERAAQKMKEDEKTYYSIGLTQEENTDYPSDLEKGRVKILEDERYGTEFTLKPNAKTRMLDMALNCTTENQVDIVDAELEKKQDMIGLQQMYIHEKIVEEGRYLTKMGITWIATFQKERPSELKLLIITESDPGTVKCNYKETGFDA